MASSPSSMGRKKKHKKVRSGDCCPDSAKTIDGNVADGSSSAENANNKHALSKKNDHFVEEQSSSVQSSWIPFTWISRHDDDDDDTISKNDAGDSSKLSLEDASTDSVPNKPAHTLLSELNDIKQQLMPAAKACADAINSATEDTYRTTPEYEFRQARSICNPYESLGLTYSKNHSRKKKNKKKRKYQSNGFSQFINRSAIKLANIDALLGFVLTSSSNNEQQQLPNNVQSNNNNNFIFADLCGAPGGFSEYILYRHVHPANENSNYECNKPCFGFGMSLLGKNDDGRGASWDLNHLKRYHLHTNEDEETAVQANSSSSTSHQLHYHVCNGLDSTGSIYNWDNVLQLQRDMTMALGHAKEAITSPQLANLVVADGGFDAQRDCNNQESIAHKIIISQTAAALSLLRPGGTFVLKMFGFQDVSTRNMLHYLYNECFDQITFVKPILSRPASAERYAVCRGYTGAGSMLNGLKWRDEMMASNERKTEQTSNKFEKLMDSFDLEMLQLNIESCRSIIRYLNEKKTSVVDDGTPQRNQRHYLSLELYEAAWQLHSKLLNL